MRIFIDLIDQRISSQNDATLIQFTARIVFDDRSSILLNSFSDFLAYREVKPLISTAVHLSWVYLIKFRNKSVPEKQQIDVSFIADRSRAPIIEENELAAGLVIRYAFGSPTPRGSIVLRISHTDRTWGADIEALLTGHLQTLVRLDSKPRQFVRSYSGSIGFVSAGVLFASIIYGGWGTFDRLKEQVTSEGRNLLANSSNEPEQLGQLLRTVLRYVLDNPTEKYSGLGFLCALLIFICCTIFGAVLANFAEASKPSFVVLTAKSEDARKVELARDQNNWSRFVTSILGALALSVIGNYLFFLVLKYYLQ